MASTTAQDTPGRPMSFGRAVGLSALIALPAGLLVAFRLNVVDGLKDHDGKGLALFAEAWSAAAYDLMWDIVIVAVFAVVVGAAFWVARRSRGKAPSAAALAALVSAALAVMIVNLVFRGWISKETAKELGRYGKRFAETEMLLVALLGAFGLGSVVYRLCRRPGGPSRVFAELLGVLSALVAWSTWASSLAAQHPAVRHRASGMPAVAGIVLASAAIGAGILLVGLSLARRGQRGPRRQLLIGLALVVVPVGVLAGWALDLERAGRAAREPQVAAPKGAPNVLWLVMDAARADALSCYGNARKTTPHLDALATESTLYERAFSVAGWTLPSHASMFTGKLPCRHGATGEHEYLDDSSVTLAEILREHGYRTFAASGNDNVSTPKNTVQGFEVAETRVYGKKARPSFLQDQLDRFIGRSDYGADDSVAMARRWITQCQTAGEPFLVFINLMEAHLEYGSTPYRGRWFDSAKQLAKANKISQKYLDYAAGVKQGTAEDFALLRRLYDGDMTYLDERIDGLIQFLRSRGLLDNTLVIITSDHGEEQGDHDNLLAHTFELYNTMLHVPLIVRYPKAFPQGAHVKRVVRLTDLFPTILDLVGIGGEVRNGLDGVSLLDEQAASKHPYAIAERYLPGIWADQIIESYPRWKGVPLWRRVKSIQDAEFKYIWASDGDDRLFDLRSDPGETINIIGKMPDKAREFKAALISQVGPLDKEAGRAK